MRDEYAIKDHVQFVADMRKAGIPTRSYTSTDYSGPAAFVPDEAGVPTVARSTKVKLSSEVLARGKGFAVHPLMTDDTRRK